MVVDLNISKNAALQVFSLTTIRFNLEVDGLQQQKSALDATSC